MARRACCVPWRTRSARHARIAWRCALAPLRAQRTSRKQSASKWQNNGNIGENQQ